jgi:hypothetical protein
VAPVALRIKVAEVQTRLLAEADVCDGTGNLARHKGASTTGALMVEEDTIACVHVVCLTIIFGNPKCIQLCDAIRAARIERSVLVLRDRLYESVKLGSRRLIEPHVVLEATGAHGIEQTQGTEGIDIACILCHLEGDFDMRLRAEIVNLGRFDLRDDVYKVGAIRQVSVVELELVPACILAGLVWKRAYSGTGKRTLVLIKKEVIDARGIEAGGATNDAMHFVPFLEQQFRPGKNKECSNR